MNLHRAVSFIPPTDYLSPISYLFYFMVLVLCTDEDEKPYVNSTCSGFTGLVEVTYVLDSSNTTRHLATEEEIDPVVVDTINILRNSEEDVRMSLENVEKVQFYSLSEAAIVINPPPPQGFSNQHGSSRWRAWVFPLIALVIFVVALVEYNKRRQRENETRWKQISNVGSLDDYLFKESDQRKSDANFPIQLQGDGWGPHLEGIDSASNEATIEGGGRVEDRSLGLGCKDFVMPSVEDIQNNQDSDLDSDERRELDDELTELKYFER